MRYALNPKLLMFCIMVTLVLTAQACSNSGNEKEDDASTEIQQTELKVRRGLAYAPKDAVLAVSSQGPLPEQMGRLIYQSLASYKEVECYAEGYTFLGSPMVLRGRDASSYMQALGTALAVKSGYPLNQGEVDWESVAGLALRPSLVLYNLGAALVLRLTIADAEKLRALMAQADMEAGYEVEMEEVHGIKVRWLAQKKGRQGAYLMMAVLDGEWVVAQVPSSEKGNKKFVEAVLGLNSNLGGVSVDAMAQDFVPNSFSGYLDVHRLVEQLKGKEQGVSATFMKPYADKLYQRQRNCKRAIDAYQTQPQDRILFASQYENDRYKVELMLPIHETTTRGLKSSLRPEVKEVGQDYEQLKSLASIFVLLNANLYQMLEQVAHSIEDEMDIVSSCKGFGYQPGALGMMIAPMRPILENVDGLRFATALRKTSGDAHFKANAQDPIALHQGLAGIAGFQLTQEMLTPEKIVDLSNALAMPIPLSIPVTAYLKTTPPKYLEYNFGDTFAPFIGKGSKMNTTVAQDLFFLDMVHRAKSDPPVNGDPRALALKVGFNGSQALKISADFSLPISYYLEREHFQYLNTQYHCQ